jgi:hypothetical protein
MTLLVKPYPELVERQEALDTVSADIFQANGAKEKEAVKELQSLYHDLDTCPDDFFEGDFAVFQCRGLDSYDTQIFIRILSYRKAFEKQMLTEEEFYRVANALYNIDMFLCELIDLTRPMQVNLALPIATPIQPS